MLALILCMAIVVSDQLTKEVVQRVFAYGESVPIIPGFFNLVYVRNTGAAWGMFGHMNVFLCLLSIGMLVALVRFRRSFLNDSILHRITLGLMLGGIIGNLMDRIRLMWVVDFLDFHIGVHHWPSFNIADSAICVGVGLYIITSLKTERKNRIMEEGK